MAIIDWITVQTERLSTVVKMSYCIFTLYSCNIVLVTYNKLTVLFLSQ